MCVAISFFSFIPLINTLYLSCACTLSLPLSFSIYLSLPLSLSLSLSFFLSNLPLRLVYQHRWYESNYRWNVLKCMMYAIKTLVLNAFDRVVDPDPVFERARIQIRVFFFIFSVLSPAPKSLWNNEPSNFISKRINFYVVVNIKNILTLLSKFFSLNVEKGKKIRLVILSCPTFCLTQILFFFKGSEPIFSRESYCMSKK